MAQQRQAFVALWVDGESVGEEIEDRLRRVEVVETTHDSASFRIVLSMAPSDTDASWPLLDDTRFELLRRISIAFGVGAQDSREPESLVTLLDGYITSVEPYFGPQRVPDSTLEICGLDASCLMHFEARVREWKNQTDAEIVKAIYDSYGFATDVAKTATARHADRSSILQRSTDAEFIRMLGRRNGFECFLEATDQSITKGNHPGKSMVGHFHAPRLDGSSQPALELAPRAFPSIVSLRARWHSHRPTTIVSRHIDPHTRKIQTATQDAPKLKKLGSKGRIDLLKPKLDALAKKASLRPIAFQHQDVPHDEAELRNFASGEFLDNDWLAEASCKVQGLRYETVVRARRLIDITGAGDQLDGPWYVRSAAHAWERDSATDTYEVDLDLVRNALGAPSSQGANA